MSHWITDLKDKWMFLASSKFNVGCVIIRDQLLPFDSEDCLEVEERFHVSMSHLSTNNWGNHLQSNIQSKDKELVYIHKHFHVPLMLRFCTIEVASSQLVSCVSCASSHLHHLK